MYGPYGVPIESLTVIICTLVSTKAAISGWAISECLGRFENTSEYAVGADIHAISRHSSLQIGRTFGKKIGLKFGATLPLECFVEEWED